MPLTIAQIITLLLTEAPAAVDLINKLKADGRTEPTEQELAELGVDDQQLQAAVTRLFPNP